MKKFISTAVLCIGFSVAAVHAADTPSKEARELMSVMRMEQSMMDGFDAMLPMIEAQAQKWQLTPSQLEEYRSIHRDWFAKDLDLSAINEQITLEYDKTFSESELQDLINFYNTPTGQKTLNEMPRLMQLGAQIGFQEGQKKEFLLKEKVKAFYEENVASKK